MGAHYFVREGANVCLVDNNQKALDAALTAVAEARFREVGWMAAIKDDDPWCNPSAELCAATQGSSAAVSSMRIKACACDVRDPKAVAKVVADTVEAFG